MLKTHIILTNSLFGVTNVQTFIYFQTHKDTGMTFFKLIVRISCCPIFQFNHLLYVRLSGFGKYPPELWFTEYVNFTLYPIF